MFDNGKPIWEARLDVQTAIDSLQYYGGLAASLSGFYLETFIMTSIFNVSFKVSSSLYKETRLVIREENH